MINSALSKNMDKQLLSNKLEEILNLNNDDLLRDLFLKKSFNQFNKRYKAFKEKYKDTKWSIQQIRNEKNKPLLNIKIISKREISKKSKFLNFI